MLRFLCVVNMPGVRILPPSDMLLFAVILLWGEPVVLPRRSCTGMIICISVLSFRVLW